MPDIPEEESLVEDDPPGVEDECTATPGDPLDVISEDGFKWITLGRRVMRCGSVETRAQNLPGLGALVRTATVLRGIGQSESTTFVPQGTVVPVTDKRTGEVLRYTMQRLG
jgi:hypothetical protein